jgi:hypothetical protein
MDLIKFQPIEQSKEKRASFEDSSDRVEITTLLRETTSALDAASMFSGHRIQVAARLLHHLELRVNEK